MRSLSKVRSLFFVSLAGFFTASCVDSEVNVKVPYPVSVGALRWNADAIPNRLLELRGYYSTTSPFGSPVFYSTESDAWIENAAEAVIIVLPDSELLQASCEDGYMVAFGYWGAEADMFVPFLLAPIDQDSEEPTHCWAVDYDWQNAPEHSHLYP